MFGVVRLKQMYESEYQIVTRGPLDRERRDKYNLALVCRDQGVEPQMSVKHIKVRR